MEIRSWEGWDDGQVEEVTLVKYLHDVVLTLN